MIDDEYTFEEAKTKIEQLNKEILIYQDRIYCLEQDFKKVKSELEETKTKLAVESAVKEAYQFCISRIFGEEK